MANQMSRKKNSGYSNTLDVKDTLKALRHRMGESQRAFARTLGVTQGAIAQWESGLTSPSSMALMSIARIDPSNKRYWYEKAGQFYADVEQTVDAYREMFEIDKESNRTILHYGKIAGGEFRAAPDQAIAKLSFPNKWLPRPVQPISFTVEGDSMSPLIESGYIVLIDRYQTDPAKLVDRIIAASNGEGLTVKWLRKIGENYFLMPNNSIHPIIPFTEHHKIIGRVIKWIGEPPPVKRK
ncbi:MAG: helix-turn-helix domain-containing protein [Acidobacteriales bacterium]|nr:helix-turn-helix domain-containing protein [Terriglobales bacterium]